MLNNSPKREHRQNGLKEQRNTAKRFNKEIIKKEIVIKVFHIPSKNKLVKLFFVENTRESNQILKVMNFSSAAC